MGSFPCRDSSDYDWAYYARYFYTRILGDYLYHVGATWLQQNRLLWIRLLKESIHCLASPSRSWAPSTSSLVGRVPRPSLLMTLSLMTVFVNWILLLWDLSLSIMIRYSKLILLKDMTNMLQRGILYILSQKKRRGILWFVTCRIQYSILPSFLFILG